MDGEPGWDGMGQSTIMTMMSSSPFYRTAHSLYLIANRPKLLLLGPGRCWWLLRRRQSASANYSSMLLIYVPTNETSAGRADSVGKSRELQKDSGGPVLAPKLWRLQSLTHRPGAVRFLALAPMRRRRSLQGIIIDTPEGRRETHGLPSCPFRLHSTYH